VPEESEEYERNLENSGQRYLNFCTDLARQKQLTIETCVRKGSVSGEIVKYSIELNADAIILGGAPADALYRDAIADSNHEVLKNARCPVLFVKPRSVKSSINQCKSVISSLVSLRPHIFQKLY
jgi:nucleotide-binding universal stress UspA family protein